MNPKHILIKREINLVFVIIIPKEDVFRGS